MLSFCHSYAPKPSSQPISRLWLQSSDSHVYTLPLSRQLWLHSSAQGDRDEVMVAIFALVVPLVKIVLLVLGEFWRCSKVPWPPCCHGAISSKEWKHGSSGLRGLFLDIGLESRDFFFPCEACFTWFLAYNTLCQEIFLHSDVLKHILIHSGTFWYDNISADIHSQIIDEPLALTNHMDTFVEHSWALLRTPGGFRWLECASALPLSCRLFWMDSACWACWMWIRMILVCPKMVESTNMALVVGTWWWNTEPKWCSWNSVKLYHLPFRKNMDPSSTVSLSLSLSQLILALYVD